ncbi:MAG: nucleotidyl transferase AbiEii/AbiGii toxin family protein [Myxococcota bacterium]
MSALEKVCTCFEKNNIPYALVGGYAVALHGVPRGTFDMDFIIRFRENDFIALEAAMISIGFKSRLPVSAKEVFQFRQEYIDNRNLIAWTFINQTNAMELVDIVLTDNLEDVSTVNKIIGTTKIQVLSKADLINMKKRAGRPQDLIDVNFLERK